VPHSPCSSLEIRGQGRGCETGYRFLKIYIYFINILTNLITWVFTSSRYGVSDNETSLPTRPLSEHWGGARIAENRQ
jgi:hypothetical protein